ncbi:MAG: glycosyltransferase family 2 protein [Chloroflexota bacterium]
MAFVSVVIPLFNKANYIQRAVNSVLRQTHQQFEIIIINDGSTDNSVSRVSEINEPRIRVINQKNKGVSAARNRGAKEASSDLIAFLDADDEWTPNFLEEMLSLASDFENCGLYGSSYYKEFEDGSREAKNSVLFRLDYRGIIPNYFEVHIIRTPIHSSSVMARKNVLLAIGGFPEDMILNEDFDTWIRFGIKSNIAIINSPLSIYHFVSKKKEYLEKSKGILVPVFLLKLRLYITTGLVPTNLINSAYDCYAGSAIPVIRTLLHEGKFRLMAHILVVGLRSGRYRGRLLRVGFKETVRWIISLFMNHQE